MVILMLYLFGGPVLEGFSLTMLIGVSIWYCIFHLCGICVGSETGYEARTHVAAESGKEGADQPSILPNQVPVDVENPGQKIRDFF